LLCEDKTLEKVNKLFSYYQHLPINDIQPKDISALYDLYKESEYKYFIEDIDYLLKYESIQISIEDNSLDTTNQGSISR
jgi:hypothetical protein